MIVIYWLKFPASVVCNIYDVWLLDCEIDYMDSTPAGAGSHSPQGLLRRDNRSHTGSLKAPQVCCEDKDKNTIIQSQKHNNTKTKRQKRKKNKLKKAITHVLPTGKVS